MLVRTREGGERECRSSFEFDTGAIPPPSLSGLGGSGVGSGWLSPRGQIWRPVDAIAMPAVSAAIHLIAETIGSLPLLVYRTDRGGSRQRAVESWQYAALHDSGPNEEATPFDFFADVAASLEAWGNAYIEKVALGEGRLELHVVNPGMVRVTLAADGSKRFVLRAVDGRTQELGSDRILHIRGFTIDGSPVGLSPISLHRRALGLLASREEFELEYFRNGAAPGGVIEVPNAFTDQAEYEEFRARWLAGHQGVGRQHRVGILTGGAQWRSISTSLADAQFAESNKFGVEEVARIFRVPSSLLGIQTTRPVTAEQDAQHFYKFSLGPRLRRIERALAADQDLFPPQLGLQPEFLADALLRADTQTRYEGYKAARQAGWLTANEIRAYENLPAVSGGDELQMTPVGGAPNDSRQVLFTRDGNGRIKAATIADDSG